MTEPENNQAVTRAQDHRVSRRTVLGSTVAGAGALALAGCGGSSSPSTASAPTTASAPRRGGTYVHGALDSSTSDSLDPTFGDSTFTNICRCLSLYDTLTLNNPHAADPPTINWLAEEVTPASDLSYWTIRVRDAEWHDGKPVTADDVMFMLRRALNPKTPSSSSAQLRAIDTNRLQKLDSKTVRAHLHYPDVSIPIGLAFEGSSMIPVGYDPKKPIGTGPFKFGSFSPGVRSTFPRNDNYWVSGKPYIDELVIVGFADPGTTRINALVSGQIDGADQIAYNLVPTVSSASDLELIISPSDNYVTWEMRMDLDPFTDTRVRQAMRLIADRPQIVEQAYSGSRFASIGNDLHAPQDALYARSIPQRSQDIERAKALLKAAGKEGLTVPLAVSNIAPGAVSTAQVLAQQATAAGVTININNLADAATYFDKYYVQAPFKIDYAATNPMWASIGFFLLPGATYNIEMWKDPTWLALVTKARGQLEFAKQKAYLGEAQQIFWNTGATGIFAFYRTAEAHNKKFTGFKPDRWGYSLNHLQFYDIYLA